MVADEVKKKPRGPYKKELPGSSCPKCGRRGRAIHLDYNDGHVPTRTFRANCECKSERDPSKPLQWTFPATDLPPTVGGQSDP